ncbi:MAG TPA: plastocyanin/azurin family copper-binding protein [Conexibacter sp.]|nr:plastocyanin/azurin family copper-binding protein [Conexibacter sp.]
MTPNVSTTRRWTALACALALAAGTLAACGDDDEDNGGASGGDTTAQTTPSEDTGGAAESAGGGVTRLTSIAEESDGLRFNRSALAARAGRVTVTLDNPSGNQLPHAFEIEGNGVEEETATIEPGARASVTVDLRPGRYTFYCPVGDHRAAGMEGTLTVG